MTLNVGVTARDVARYVAAVRRDPCAYCGAPAETAHGHRGKLDHILARNCGGGNGWLNVTATCGSCNSSKRDTSLLGFLAFRRWREEWLHAESTLSYIRQLRRVGA